MIGVGLFDTCSELHGLILLHVLAIRTRSSAKNVQAKDIFVGCQYARQEISVLTLSQGVGVDCVIFNCCVLYNLTVLMFEKNI